MKCFKWRTKLCLNSENAELCNLMNQEKYSMDLTPSFSNGSEYVMLRSPGFEDNKYRNRQLCIYNVSLDSCPGKHVDIKSVNRNDVVFQDEGDYLAFYTNRDQVTADRSVSGSNVNGYWTTLDSNTFLLVMWTNFSVSNGRFEMQAKCSDHSVPTSPSVTTEEEGSGWSKMLNLEEQTIFKS